VDSCTGTVAEGHCHLTLHTLGARTLTASYVGPSPFYYGATDTEPHSVITAGALITITHDSPDPSLAGSAFPVSYTVTANPPGAGAPTGGGGGNPGGGGPG